MVSTYYLGKKYKLRFMPGKRTFVTLKRNHILITHKKKLSKKKLKALLDKWYLERAKIVFPPLMKKCWSTFKYKRRKTPRLIIRQMKYCWGSISMTHYAITINRHLMKFPRACLIYVMFHELCHLRSMYHNEKFYECMDVALPNWKRARRALDTWKEK